MKVIILAFNILDMKITMLLIILVLFNGCDNNNDKSEENDKILKFTWMEFGWLANDSGEVTSLNVISYLEIKNDSTALVASKESFDGNLIYKQVSLNDSINSEIADFIRNKMDSTYLYDVRIDKFIYCGNKFYLNYSLSEKDSNQILFIPPKAPENLKKLKIMIEALVKSPSAIMVPEFPFNNHFLQILDSFGNEVLPPKIDTTKFIPPIIMDILN